MVKIKICLACSAGGHLNQLKEFIPYLSNKKYYFVTLDRSDSRVILKNSKKYYIKDTSRNIISTLINCYESLRIIKKEKPTIIISNGGGAALFTCLWGKIFGAKIMFIESFARILKPSLFGKIVSRFADITFVQWKSMKKFYSNSYYYGPIFNFNIHKSKKKKKYDLFITVGTSIGFNRLIRKIDQVCKDKKLRCFAQIAKGKYVPNNMKYARFLSFDKQIEHFKKSRIAITHGGTGSIINSIKSGSKTIAVPRLKKYKEHVDDHQIEVVKQFEKKGYVLACYDVERINEAIEKTKNFKKKIRGTKSELIKELLKDINYDYNEN